MSSTGASGGATLIGIPLRSGGALSMWPDRLETAGVSYPLADIAWAGLVNDPASPQGAQPLPAVAWRMANGQYASVTPADPPHAWQILEALYTQRPDLRTPLPPPAPSVAHPGGWGPPPPQYGYSSAYAGSGYAPPQSNDNQTVMAGLAHLSILFGAPWVALILWLVNRGKLPFAADNARRAFFYQLAYLVIVLVATGIFFVVYFGQIFPQLMSASYTTPYSSYNFMSFYGFILIFDGVLLVVQIVAIIFGVIGAVKAFQGKTYHYPLMGRV